MWHSYLEKKDFLRKDNKTVRCRNPHSVGILHKTSPYFKGLIISIVLFAAVFLN